MQRGTTRWTVVAASAAVLMASSGLALASQSLAKPTQTQTVRVGDGYVRTWIDAGRPMVAISLDGLSEQRVVEQRGTVMLRYAEFDPAGVIPAVPQNLQAVEGNRAFIVQYISQPLEAYGQAIAQLGGTVERFMPDQAQIVTIDPSMVDAVRALPFVRWVGAYHPAYKLNEPELQRLSIGSDSPVYQRYSIQTLRRGNGSLDGLSRLVHQMGARVDLESHPVGRLEAWLTDDQVLAVAQRSDVLFMDFRGEPEKDVDIARMIGGANYIESEGGFSGEGVRFEDMDGGFYLTHQEYAGTDILQHGSVGLDSHGTATLSIVYAQGTDPQARGFIPDAEQAIVAAYGSLGDRYAHTQELVDPTGEYRAVFQTNSWGGPRTTAYETMSAEMDDILFDMNITITQSQSNSGSTPSRPQAWAKNILSVGGFNHFNTLDRSDDRHGGTTGSTGPAADGRIKPDLSHFYDQTWAASSGTSSYTQFGGTSGATPVTAGHVGLLYQMWNEGVFGPVRVPGGTVFENRPMNSTIKAMMVNTGMQYDFVGTSADMNRMRQGWGTADVGKLYDERERFFIVDGTDVLTPLASNSYPLKVASDEPDLRVTMIYNDPSGTTSATKHRINDLTLKVTSPSGAVYWGNNGLTIGTESTPGGTANDLDTVENVLIISPEGGVWTVEVIAAEINQDGHVATPALDASYSLVVAGVTPAIGLSLLSDVPEIVLPGTVLTVEAEVIEGDETLDGIPQIFYDATGSGFTQADMVQVGDHWEFDLPAAACGTTPAFYMEVTGSGGTTVSLPALGADGPYDIDRVGEDLNFGEFDFETSAGWVVSGTTLSGDWELGTPDGYLGRVPDGDFDGSGQAYVTGSERNEDVDLGPTILTSPMFELAGAPDDIELRYARWFFNDDQKAGSTTDADRLKIEITDNGGLSWELVESVNHALGGEDWGARTVVVSDYVDLTNQVQLRFSVEDRPNDSRTEAALDALSITGFRCESGCPADIDGDGDLTLFDFLAFQNAFDMGDLAADFDGDGSLTLFDFLAFQNEFDAGCP